MRGYSGMAALVVGGSVMLTGCSSGSSGSAGSPAGAQVPPSGEDGGAIQVGKVCPRLDTARVAQIAHLASPVTATDTEEVEGSKVCWYNQGQGTSVDIAVIGEKQQDFDMFRGISDKAGDGKSVTVPGLGDEAYYMPTKVADSVTVHYKGLRIVVAVITPELTSSVPQAVELARYVVTKY